MNGLIFLLLILAVGMILVVVVGGAKPKKFASKRTRNRVGSIDREFVSTKWATIEAMASGGGSLRDAVSEADKLLDYALKQVGARGETMGERLKSSGSRFSNINDIWTAHKLRNTLAHEAQFDLVPSQAREAISYFECGLRDLGAL